MAASAVLTLSPKVIGPFLTLSFQLSFFFISSFFRFHGLLVAYLPVASCAHVGSRFTACCTHGSQDLPSYAELGTITEEYRHPCFHLVFVARSISSSLLLPSLTQLTPLLHLVLLLISFTLSAASCPYLFFHVYSTLLYTLLHLI